MKGWVCVVGLCVGLSAPAQDTDLRTSLRIVGRELESTVKPQQASMFLCFTGAVLFGIGLHNENAALTGAGLGFGVGGMVCAHIAIGRKKSAARKLIAL